MNKIFAGILTVSFLALPSQAQVRRGSLVVVTVSKQADFVVVGAESRSLESKMNFVDDSACKVLSLGGDTLFYKSGVDRTGAYDGKSWTATGTARSVYKSSLNRAALSLSAEWSTRTLRWFNSLPEQEILSQTKRSNGILVNDGFISFDLDGKLSVHSVEIVYNPFKRRLDVHSESQAPGETVMAGVAMDLVDEFLRGKTDRAIRALGPDSMLRFRGGVDQTATVGLVQKAIKFAMDNATGEDRLALGGDIDVAIIHRDRTIEWVSRKPLRSKQDLKPTALAKSK